MFKKKQTVLVLMALAVTPALAATPTTWTTTIDAATYGSVGSITFNDWGYKGPTGVGANDFAVTSTVTGITGFDSTRIGQIQRVITTAPDFLTPDAGHYVTADGSNTSVFPNADMDGSVNFYKWAYTTPAGSTFNNMMIDKAGNYKVARSDMNFGYYDSFTPKDKTTGADLYTNPVTGSHTWDTSINFQPYAISDAKGWCGSVLTSNPNGLAEMAGQVTFDFAFDAFLNNQPKGTTDAPATQIVPGFIMRSYGDYVVDVTGWNPPLTDEFGELILDENGNPIPGPVGDNMHYTGSAVGNNTNPTTGALDPAFANKVSFLGGGVVPKGVWVFNDGTQDVTVAATQGAAGTVAGEIRGDGAAWHSNSFAGFAFLLRADAGRTLEFIGPTGHSDYVATSAAAYTSIGMTAPVPVPAAAWLLGSGLMGLVGVARRQGASKIN